MDINEVMSCLKKRVNVSVVPEKTMERSREVWTSFKHVQKQETLALADVTAATAHNTYKKGHISAPLAISMAQVAGINPAYLSGQAATRGRFSAKTVKAFLLASGYTLPAGLADEDEAVLEPVCQEPEEEAVCPECAEECTCAELLSGEQLVTLLQALAIKATICDTARGILGEVQTLLLK